MRDKKKVADQKVEIVGLIRYEGSFPKDFPTATVQAVFVEDAVRLEKKACVRDGALVKVTIETIDEDPRCTQCKGARTIFEERDGGKKNRMCSMCAGRGMVTPNSRERRL